MVVTNVYDLAIADPVPSEGGAYKSRVIQHSAETATDDSIRVSEIAHNPISLVTFLAGLQTFPAQYRLNSSFSGSRRVDSAGSKAYSGGNERGLHRPRASIAAHTASGDRETRQSG